MNEVIGVYKLRVFRIPTRYPVQMERSNANSTWGIEGFARNCYLD